ncbi:hypothetical protein F5884DRAFT_153066 [Xylogone sp. PMI_703]|nr:hypothetical protein F5884DRAFT_153066 [Xylogone sp. PMI_703]
MNCNFFEIISLEPRQHGAFADQTFLRELQGLVDTIASEPGTINCQIRRCVDPDYPNRMLFITSWDNIQAHDQLDVKGLTPRLLKTMLKHLNPISSYFMYMDSAKVDFSAPIHLAAAYHVRPGQAPQFQRHIDANPGLAGSWYVTKKMPPLPTVMPTDPEELRLLEEGRRRAEDRLRAPNPEIWISLTTPGSPTALFGRTVEGFVREVQTGRYQMLLQGRKL